MSLELKIDKDILYHNFLQSLNRELPQYYKKYKLIKEVQNIEDIIREIDYPFEVKVQKLGSTKEEILNSLEKIGIFPFSIPFIKYNSKDDNFYLVYHLINYDKFIDAYPEIKNPLVDSNIVKTKSGILYIATIDNILKENIEKLLKSVIINDNTNQKFKILNYNTRFENISNFLQLVKHLSQKGFSILLLNPNFEKYNSNNTIPLAIIPDNVAKFPNLYSVEHEIDVKSKDKSIELFNKTIVESKPLSLLRNGEMETIDGSLDPLTGHEFVIGGHLLPNLIWKIHDFFNILEENNLLFEKDLKNHENWKNYYGLHISISVPNVIDEHNLFQYLHNIGIIYDLITRHKNRIEQERTLNANTIFQFQNGFRGIFRFMRQRPKLSFEELIRELNMELNINTEVIPDIVKNFYGDIYPQIKDLLNLYKFIQHNQIKFGNQLDVKNELKNIKQFTILFEKDFVEFFNMFPTFKDLLLFTIDTTKRGKPLYENFEKMKIISELFKSDNFKFNNLLSEEFLNILKSLNLLSSNNENLKVLEDILNNKEKLKVLNNIYENTKKKFFESDIKVLREFRNKKLTNLIHQYDKFIRLDFERLDIDIILNFLKSIEHTSLDKELKKLTKDLYYQIINPSNTELNLMNRLEIRFPQSGYTMDYIINNLVFTAKMTKDIFLLSNSPIQFDFEDLQSEYSQSKEIRKSLRFEIKNDKDLRNFLVKNMLGFTNSEFLLFEQYFEKYC